MKFVIFYGMEDGAPCAEEIVCQKNPIHIVVSELSEFQNTLISD
jgi:chaperonin GroEL (HSP60 family)